MKPADQAAMLDDFRARLASIEGRHAIDRANLEALQKLVDAQWVEAVRERDLVAPAIVVVASPAMPVDRFLLRDARRELEPTTFAAGRIAR